MTIRYLRTLIATADYGSFGAAAEAVHISQSAVSMQMRAIEESVGAEIFDRSTRPPSLTPTGRQVLNYARRIVFLYDEMRDNVSDVGNLSGTLALGAVPTTLVGLMPRALAMLRSIHPRLQIALKFNLSASLVESIRRGEIDAAILSQPPEPLPGISIRPIKTEPLFVIAPRCAQGKSAREILEELPYIQFSKLAWVGQIIDNHLRKNAITVRPAMELDSLEAITVMVHHGLGASVVPQSCFHHPALMPLERIQIELPGATRTLALAERDPNPKDGLTSAVFGILQQIGNAGREAPVKSPAAARSKLPELEPT